MQTDIKEVSPSETQPIPTEQPSVAVPEPVASEQPKGKSKTLMVVIITILVLALLGGLTYAAFFFSSSQEEEDFSADSFEEQEFEFEEQESEETPAPIYSDYLGTYIDAQLPEEWQIIEYEDGQGSDMLMSETEYTGLTGISILTNEDEEVFQLYAVMGIGSIDICYSVAKFSDTPQSYIDQINSLTTDYNEFVLEPEPMPEVEQIANGEYSEISLIDYRGRRVESRLYWNDLENNNAQVFHPLCGLSGEILTFETLSFEYGGSMGFDEGYSYGVKIIGDPGEETLLILDDVLSSIVLKD